MTNEEWWLRATCTGGTILVGTAFFAKQWWVHRDTSTRGEIVAGIVFYGLFTIVVTILMFVL